ncbi:hypothetical protein ACQP1G_22205 [Nocardia sp. CA-107356]|uniref:hypothetical protein n=1 Tax=Nocardia sp. CA-107356 TaxID=3239972 RepID=UPI003D8E0CAE
MLAHSLIAGFWLVHKGSARIPFPPPTIMAFVHQLPEHLEVADGIGKAPVQPQRKP